MAWVVFEKIGDGYAATKDFVVGTMPESFQQGVREGNKARHARKMAQLEGKELSATGKEIGRFLGNKRGTMAVGANRAKNLGKFALLGGIAVAGLAYLASAGKKRVTPQSVANESLEPEDFSAITPTVPEEAVLPPLGGPTMMGMEAQPGEWAERVSTNMGPEGPEKLASAPTPSIADDLNADRISTEQIPTLGA